MSNPHLPPRYAVIYDGNCGVCRRFVVRLAEWDSKKVLEIAPSQGPGIPERFSWIAPAAFGESIQLIRLGDGKTWAAAAALEELLGILPRGRAVSWVFHIPLVRRLADRVYRAIARNRYRLDCSNHCRND